jgi:hypothetical protein
MFLNFPHALTFERPAGPVEAGAHAKGPGERRRALLRADARGSHGRVGLHEPHVLGQVDGVVAARVVAARVKAGKGSDEGNHFVQTEAVEEIVDAVFDRQIGVAVGHGLRFRRQACLVIGRVPVVH